METTIKKGFNPGIEKNVITNNNIIGNTALPPDIQNAIKNNTESTENLDKEYKKKQIDLFQEFLKEIKTLNNNANNNIFSIDKLNKEEKEKYIDLLTLCIEELINDTPSAIVKKDILLNKLLKENKKYPFLTNGKGYFNIKELKKMWNEVAAESSLVEELKILVEILKNYEGDNFIILNLDNIYNELSLAIKDKAANDNNDSFENAVKDITKDMISCMKETIENINKEKEKITSTSSGCSSSSSDWTDIAIWAIAGLALGGIAYAGYKLYNTINDKDVVLIDMSDPYSIIDFGPNEIFE